MFPGPLRSRSPLLTYGLAVLLVAAVVGLKWVVPPLGRDAPFLMMFGPTLLAAWYGGLGPGIFAAVLGTAAVHYFFLPPYFDIRASPLALVHSLVFGTMSIVGSALMASTQSSRRRAEAAARRVEGMYAVSAALGGVRALSGSLDPKTRQDVSEVILHEAAAVLGAVGVAIYLTSDIPTDRGGTLRLVAHLGRDPKYLAVAKLTPFKDIPIEGEAPAALAARTRAVVAVESEDEFRARFPAHYAAAEGRPIPPALMCAPMIATGHVIGVLGVGFANAQRIRRDDRSWVQALAQACGMAAERGRLFEREKRARIEAQEASEAKDQFLAVVSHELRAPLTTIVGWAHMLRKRKQIDRPRYEHGLDVIERSAQAQARLVEDILDMSRIAARKLKVDVKAIDLAPLVRASVEELRVKAAAKGIDLEQGADVEAIVVGDPERLRQVMHKVLLNAFRFTPPGGHVSVEMELLESCVFVRIKDDGRGIPPDRLSQLFEAFGKGKREVSRRERGLGLGLAIANYIVQEHRGALRVESPGSGRGTTVSVELPLAEPTAGALAVSSGPGAADAPRLTGVRVLVVDDDTDAREALAELLTADGAEVRPTPSKTAIDALKEFSPNVIVSDVDVPEPEGNGFIRKVRELPPPWAMVPALALTARSRPAEGQAVLAAGYQRQLTKPPEPRALTEAVAELRASAV